MSLALDDLPRDHELLQLQHMTEVVAAERSRSAALEIERDTVLAERDAACAERDAAQAEIEKLRLLIRQLQRGQFGRRSERLDPHPLQLGLEDPGEAAAGRWGSPATARTGSTPTSCSWVSRTWSRPPRPPRRPRRRWLQGAAPLVRPGFGDAIWAACRLICHGSRSWSTSRTRAARAAAGPCTSSVRTRARCSTSSRPSCG